MKRMSLVIAILIALRALSSVPVFAATEDTVLYQTIYLWDEGNMPTTTLPEAHHPRYFDDADFRPNMVYYPVADGVEIKGAVLICVGGAFQLRAATDGEPVASRLNELGYQCFVVNYRIRPYSVRRPRWIWDVLSAMSEMTPKATASTGKT